MTYVSVELFLLLLVSFLAGVGAAAALLRLVVRRTPEQVSAYVAEGGRRR